MARIVNLTTHPITVYAADRPIASWPPSGPLARLAEIRRDAEPLSTDQGDIPVTEISYAPEVLDLPAPAAGTAYIVSRVLAAQVRRDDLYFPFDEVRDGAGRIVGCRGFGRFQEVADAD